MKKKYYYASSLIMLIGCWCAFCGYSLYKGRIIPFIVESIIFVVVLFKKDYVFYPYISSLHIDENCIERCILGWVHTTIGRDDAQIYFLKINNTQFVVFSLDKLEHYWAGSVASLARNHRAIMYPVSEKMLVDFPELFEGFDKMRTTL